MPCCAGRGVGLPAGRRERRRESVREREMEGEQLLGENDGGFDSLQRLGGGGVITSAGCAILETSP